MGRTLFFLEALENDLFPHLFQFLEASCIPWLLTLSSSFKASNVGPSPSHAAISGSFFIPLLRTLLITAALLYNLE